ncbi:MAG: glycosyltransferase family 4 protein [Bryobacteraceae bacterium]
MKIAVLSGSIPIGRSRMDEVASALLRELAVRGHDAESFRIPFDPTPDLGMIHTILAARRLRVANVDRIICLDFPAYCIPHPNKIIWLLQNLRQAYDSADTPYPAIPDTKVGRSIRESVLRADGDALAEASLVVTGTLDLRSSISKFHGRSAEVLRVPPIVRSAISIERGSFVLCSGPVRRINRQHLLVEAINQCQTPVRLIISGFEESRAESGPLREAIRRNGVPGRIEWISEPYDELERTTLMSSALAGAWVSHADPQGETFALESFRFSKPMITCSDSGGIAELVVNGASGWVTAPASIELAKVMDEAYMDRERTANMGLQAHAHAQSLEQNWDEVIERLIR